MYNRRAFPTKNLKIVQLSTDRVRRLTSSTLLFLTAGAMTLLGAGRLYAQQGSAEAGQAKSAVCAACHGADGNSAANAEWPSLAAQHAAYTVRQLEAYKDGQRPDPGMQGFAQSLTDEDMRDLAAFYATQPITVKGTDPELVERGQRIYRGGIAERGVAACIACHGPSGKGNPLAGYPRVSHQHSPYLATTLRAYRSGSRRSDAPLNQMMRNVAELLLDDEIEALASYMQGLN
ncbi:MAG TPA: c-type cytochrome [Gammaproteobacteria bacterium]|nr:c-type cytochrome [Gammaproteobacteria bacterium]